MFNLFKKKQPRKILVGKYYLTTKKGVVTVTAERGGKNYIAVGYNLKTVLEDLHENIYGNQESSLA